MEIIKLNLGAGATRIPGFINVDMNPLSKADIAASIDDLPFEPESVQTLYASHVLEHYLKDGETADRNTRTLGLLGYWNGLLKQGGEVFIGVPDFGKLCKLFVENENTESVQESIVDAVFGGQRDRYDFHYSGFTRKNLERSLKIAGFDHVQTFEPFLNDETKHTINGTNISLNLRAVKQGAVNADFFVPPKVPEDEISVLRKAADERLSGMINLKKHVDYLESERNKLSDELVSLKKSPRLLIKALLRCVLGKKP